MPNEQEVNKIAQKIGATLIDNGIKFLRMAFHIDPVMIEGTNFAAILKAKFPNIGLSFMDGKYYAIPFWQWKQLIEVDWTHLRPWVLDKFDCDNFGYAFSSYTGQIFEVNTGGCVYGKVLNKDTGKLIDYHYWNIIVSAEADGSRHIYFYEPESTKYVEYTGGDIIIGTWKYIPITFLFF